MSATLIILLTLLLVLFKLLQFLNKDPQTTEKEQSDLGINDISQLLQQHPLQTAKLTPLNQQPQHPWDSFFGGHAYWPNNKGYPLTADGQPMTLIAQINCNDLIGLNGFPNHGLLQFFIANDDMYGLNFDTPFEQSYKNTTGHRVVFHPSFNKNTDEWHVKTFKTTEDFSPISGCYALSVSTVNETPSPTDHRFDQLVIDPMSLSDDVSDWLYDNHRSEGSKIGGYANFTQDDPRRYTKDSGWLLLFQLDSSTYQDINIMWGDCGVGNFFIKPEDLAKLDFSQVCYSWDCC